MSLTYDGIIHRSLEEQVRYDAEQVQLLKQADVTINENLQTINTELDGKLTKPTNPSAESAVTMLSDGTVGTKPLSEIGGGGKLYLHYISITGSNYILELHFYSSKGAELTLEEISSKYKFTICGYNGEEGMGTALIYITGTNNITIDIHAIINAVDSVQGLYKKVENPQFTDTITEL